MIFVYRRPRSDSARVLAEQLGGRRLRRLPTVLRADDRVVAWGEALQARVPVLNGAAPLRTKRTDAEVLREKGVATIEVSRTRPADPTGWLPRSNNHRGGNDLLGRVPGRDFWVRKLDIRQEFRVHSFLGRSIRSGVKVPREGFAEGAQAGRMGLPQLSPWIRSWDGGWRIAYRPDAVKQKHRDLAHAAVDALGLDFGAVDIGQLADGSLVVLEVNRAPGLEGGTIEKYAAGVRKWVSGEWTKENRNNG